MDWLWQAMRLALGCDAVQAGFGRARACPDRVADMGQRTPRILLGRHVGRRGGMTYAIPLSGLDGGLTKREWQ